jgi:hypothetical protein
MKDESHSHSLTIHPNLKDSKSSPYLCKPSTYLVVTYFPAYLPIYMRDLFPTELVTKVKPNTKPVEVHP